MTTNIDIAKKLKDPEELAKSWLRSLPQGYLYNETLIPFIKSFCESYSNFLKDLNKGINDLFNVTADNTWLEELKAEYGVPNVLFPTINTNDEAALAITAMKISRNLLSKEDFKNFMLLLGYDVEFYHYQNNLLENTKFKYKFPMILGANIRKNKFKYLVYFNEQEQGQGANLNTPLPMILRSSNSRINNVKNILDFIKPDYIIFEYITTQIKTQYGL